jgi:hypothetical protein
LCSISIFSTVAIVSRRKSFCITIGSLKLLAALER